MPPPHRLISGDPRPDSPRAHRERRSPGASATSQRVREEVMHDTEEPGAKRPIRMVRLARAMETKERLLVEVFRQQRITKPSDKEAVDTAGMALEELAKSRFVSCLIGHH